MVLDYRHKTIALEYTKELMVAKMSNSQISIDEEGGKNAASFMKEIYNEFVTLSEDVYGVK